MFAAQRRALILELLRIEEAASLRDLSEKLNM